MSYTEHAIEAFNAEFKACNQRTMAEILPLFGAWKKRMGLTGTAIHPHVESFRFLDDGEMWVTLGYAVSLEEDGIKLHGKFETNDRHLPMYLDGTNHDVQSLAQLGSILNEGRLAQY